MAKIHKNDSCLNSEMQLSTTQHFDLKTPGPIPMTQAVHDNTVCEHVHALDIFSLYLKLCFQHCDRVVRAYLAHLFQHSPQIS